jgi:hypothetical protein
MVQGHKARRENNRAVDQLDRFVRRHAKSEDSWQNKEDKANLVFDKRVDMLNMYRSKEGIAKEET